MQAVGRSVSQLVETVPSAPIPSIPLPSEADLTEDPPDLEEEEELRGLADLRAALWMVASGIATSVTICGFPDGHELLAVGRELAIEGIEVEPLIRRGGGGFDIRVHRVP
jgi:hypothetical protein